MQPETIAIAASDEHADQAFLFEEKGTSRRAVTRAPLQLPPSDQGWELAQTFSLGVQHVMPIDLDPEPVLRAILADGFYVWSDASLPEPSGTGQ